MKQILFALFLLTATAYAAEDVEPQVATESPQIKKKKKKETKVFVRADHPFMTQGPLHERKLD